MIFLFLLMILLKNSFSFNEPLKILLLCKFLSPLDYPYTLDYKKVLLTSYAATQTIKDFCSVNFFFSKGPTHNTSINFFVLLRKKTFSTLKTNSQLWGKILNCKRKSPTQEKILTLDRVLNSWENSQLRINFSTREDILISKGKFST